MDGESYFGALLRLIHAAFFGHLTGAMQQGAEKAEAVRALTLTLNAIARNSLRRKPSGLTIKSEEAQPQGSAS
jgi:hypothetical protein